MRRRRHPHPQSYFEIINRGRTWEDGSVTLGGGKVRDAETGKVRPLIRPKKGQR